MAAHKKIRIAIVGAGIGGLTLSAALDHLDPDQQLEVTIYESSASLSEIGAGINFWPRTWRILKEIGLENALLKLLGEEPNDLERVVFHFRKADQSSGVSIRDLKMNGGSLRFYTSVKVTNDYIRTY